MRALDRQVDGRNAIALLTALAHEDVNVEQVYAGFDADDLRGITVILSAYVLSAWDGRVEEMLEALGLMNA